MKRVLCVVLLSLVGCSTGNDEAMVATIRVDSTAKSTHVVLTARAAETELKTKCMPVPSDKFLDVAILRRQLPRELELTVIGFSDDACASPTMPAENAGPLTRAFEPAKTVAALLVLKPADAARETNCGDGLDDDGDGDVDCRDLDCDSRECVSTNRCVEGQRCSEGTCQGGTEVRCNNPPSCFVQSEGVCVVESGCQYLPNVGASCDDGNSCTAMDRCTNTGACMGTQSMCTTPPVGAQCVKPLGACLLDGGCDYAVDVDAACDDGNSCTTADTCDATGTCRGTNVVCAPADCRVGAGCAADGGCEFTPVDAGTSCSNGGSCNATGGCLPPFPFVPSNVELADVPTPPNGKVVFNCGVTEIDTKTSGAPTVSNACSTHPPLSHASIVQGGVATLVLAFDDLEITGGNTLRFIGSRPVIVVSMKNIDVFGDIEVLAGAQACAGNGAGGNGGGGTLGWQSGGGGGGFGSVGARGGDVDNAPDGLGGAINGGASLRGGCPGGRGGNNPNGAARGGGALQLVARETLSLSGIINAPGSGGQQTTSRDGKPGRASDEPAPGGTDDFSGGRGGNGAAGTTAATAGGDANIAAFAGGGGGGVGRVRINVTTICDIGPPVVMSPAAISNRPDAGCP